MGVENVSRMERAGMSLAEPGAAPRVPLAKGANPMDKSPQGGGGGRLILHTCSSWGHAGGDWGGPGLAHSPKAYLSSQAGP